MVLIRPTLPDDLPALTEIYNHYVRHSHVTFDVETFSVDDRRPWFDAHVATGPHRLLVAVDETGVAGYATSSSFRVKPGYASTVETSVYLHPERTGRGHGRALYNELFAQLTGIGLHRAVAGIALPNPASVALHLAHGFTEVGRYTEVGFKQGRWVDVQWFERPLD